MAVYLDTNLSIEARVDALLAEMTIEEKASQIAGLWVTDLLDDERRFQLEKLQTKIPYGIGHISRVGAASMLPPVESARLSNQIQRFLAEETRLGIPAIVHEESCAGYLAKGATSYPQAIGLAATWEPELIQQMADAIRQEMRVVGAHHTLAPVLDIARDARWGRMEETFGEDPYLISQMGNAYIRGIQTDDIANGVIATAKHFIGYGLSEGGMNWAPAHIPERELLEMFAVPFAAAIQEANVASVMNAYQELDGEPAGSSKKIMVDLLRNKLGFNGTVVSDYFTIDMFVNYHKIAATKADAARFALEAGIDVELPGRDCYGQPLIDALNAGTIDIALVDTCVRRVLIQKFQLGIFENRYADEGTVVEIYSKQPLDLSRELAQKSIVLLKNDGLLPLKKGIDKIAILGPHADSVRLAQGDYHYPAHLEGILNMPDNMDAPSPAQQKLKVNWAEHFPPTVTTLQGIQSLVGENSEIAYSKGCDVMSEDKSGFAEAVTLASEADIAIIIVGDKSGLGRDNTTGEARDRASLRLSGVQQDLIEAVHATGTPTVVVLMTGRPYELNWIHENIPAILQVWLPAQQGGTAIADVLFGDMNPGGKLPVSFPRSVGQIPVYYNHKPSGQRSHWHGDYVDMPTTPLYTFGHGLSYTSFEYSNLQLSASEVRATDTVSISVDVTNCGEVAGDEVVQLYIGDPVASITRPVKALKGFKRLTLQPGETKTVTFDLDVRHAAFYDRKMNYVVEAGTITVMVGASSSDIRLTGEFSVVGETTPVTAVYTTPVRVSS